MTLISVPVGVPAAPNRPIAQERSCTSVILRWLPPSSTGNCTISGYTVEYREEGAPSPPALLFLSSLSLKEGLQSHKTICLYAFHQLFLLVSPNSAQRPQCRATATFDLKHRAGFFARMIMTHGRLQSTFTCTSLLNQPDHSDRDHRAHFTDEEAKA